MYILVFLILLTAVGLTFGNLQLIKSNQGGGDFLAHWQAARSFLAQGTSPYPQLNNEDQSPGIPELTTPTAESTKPPVTGTGVEQLLATPQATQPVVPQPATDSTTGPTSDETQAPESGYKFLSPLYAMLVYIPLALIKDPDLARAIWMTILELLLFYAGYMSVRWLKWKKPILISFLLVLFALFAYASFSSILNGYLGIFSLACMVVVITVMQREQDEIAGIALALALFRPETVYVTVLFLLVWSIINQRRNVFYWFLGTLILLVGFSMLLIPDWVPQYFRTLVQFGVNNPVSTTVVTTSIFSGISLRLTIARNVLMLILLVVEWFFVRTKNSLRLVWVTLLTMVVSIWIGVKVNPDASIFILPAIFFALSLFYARWKESSYPAMALVLMLLFMIGWIFSGFFFGNAASTPVVIATGYILPALGVLLLYWSRWWILYSTSQNLE